LSDAVGLLLSSVFTGLPVIDNQGQPVGVITQSDLITRGGMPLRLGLLAVSEKDRLDTVLKKIAGLRVADAMTTPAITIASDRRLSEAVDLMLGKGVKRLPVVDENGRLSGMLSRLDIFRTVMREAPDWKAFKAQAVEVDHLKRVKDILRRDTRIVSPETPIEEVIRIIDQNDIQRVAVVDTNGRLMGLISDHDLLSFFKQNHEGIWGLLARVKQAFSSDAHTGDLRNRLADTLAATIMNTDLVTVREETLIEEAIMIMTEKALKRLPVVDEDDRFKGMISRDSLLRTGFGKA
jgi:CBS domain-containing protein